MKKIAAAALLMILIAVSSPSAAPAAQMQKNLGMSLSVFLTQMGVAYGKVKWGYSPDRLDDSLIKTPEGGYMAEYNESIALFINMTDNGEKIKNTALSFIMTAPGMGFETPRGMPDGEEQYVGVCTQLILASNLNMDIKTAGEILTELGVYGPVLDGRQRHVRSGRFTYIMKLHKTGAVIMVVSAL